MPERNNTITILGIIALIIFILSILFLNSFDCVYYEKTFSTNRSGIYLPLNQNFKVCYHSTAGILSFYNLIEQRDIECINLPLFEDYLHIEANQHPIDKEINNQTYSFVLLDYNRKLKIIYSKCDFWSKFNYYVLNRRI